MSARRVVVLALMMIVCLGTSAWAQDADLPLANWGAPPYWTPPAAPPSEPAPGGGLVARAEGMRAQAEALPSSPLPFVAIAPCRIVDTRVAVSDGFHQPNFIDDESRTFPFPSSPDCTGLPATAGAWSINVQFRAIAQLSFLTAYPTGTTMPSVSTLTAGPAAWVQNAAIVPAGTGGAIDIYCQYAGRVVIDINGYYGPQSVVTSLNTKAGDVTLAAGSNIAITPSGGTLTIAMTGVPGGTLPAGTADQTLYSNGSGWLASSALTNDGTNVGITGTLDLPNTTASAGQVRFGGETFLHNYGPALAQNTFVGQQAGNLTMGGTDPAGKYNTAIGYRSLSSNTTGSTNTAIGVYSLSANTTGIYNTACGAYGLRSNTMGSSNTATGYGSLLSNTTGYSNTASGVDSLWFNTKGHENTATGSSALLYNTTANNNTAMGNQALQTQSFSNTNTAWDSDNTALGYRTLYANQPASTNTGIQNTAVGSQALQSNTTGSLNTASGYSSLRSSTTGSNNTANGGESLRNNTTGSTNTAIGYQALYNNSEGNLNIGIGFRAGYYVTTGSYNIYIGNMGDDSDLWTVRIGDANQSRTFIAGIRNVTTGLNNAIPVLIDAAGQLGTVSSSIRFKQDVASMGEASNGLMELRPVTFRYKAYPDGPLQYGLIAEEVENVMPDLVVRDATGQVETVAYHELPAMLLNELQKQQAKIAAQQVVIEVLTSRLAALEQRLPRTP